MEVAAQKPLGLIAWERHRATVWAMTDPAGAIAKGGGGPQQAALAKMNEYGTMAVQAVAQMNTLEAAWRQSVEGVRKTTAQSAIDIKKVEAELPALRTLGTKDEDFFRDVNDYVSGMENAEGIVGGIKKAEEGVKKALSALKGSETWKKVNDKAVEVKEDQQKVEEKQKEIEDAKRLAHEVFDIGEKIIKMDWSGLASKALEFARDKAIDTAVDAQFGQDLSDLKDQLAKAETELKSLKDEAFQTDIETARHGVNEALIELDNAKNKFLTALKQLDRLQKHASDKLNKSPATAMLGTKLQQRTKQLHAVSDARTMCERYGHFAETERKNMTLVSNKYGTVGSWLDTAAAADPAFDRSKPYAKMLERSALSNSVELGRWDNWTESVQGECQKAIAWLGDTSPKGPMVHFERAVAIAKQSISNPQ